MTSNDVVGMNAYCLRMYVHQNSGEAVKNRRRYRERDGGTLRCMILEEMVHKNVVQLHGSYKKLDTNAW